MIIYINRRDSWFTETVSECKTRREALLELREWRLSDRVGYYYLSNHKCANWV